MDMDLIENGSVEIIGGRKIVKKHVAAIHSSNNLSLLERKISNVLLYIAFPTLKTEKYHFVTISKLRELLDFNSNNTKALKVAIQNLQRTVIELNLLNDTLESNGLEEGLFSIQLLGLFQVIEKGTIKYSYPSELIDLLSNPSVYAKINLPVQAKFRSSYSLALYENCVRFRGLPYTKDFDYRVFRKLMGVEDGKYEIFRDFNRRVLTPAVTEINTCSDIRITPDITKRGRRVSSIKFVLGERPMKRRLGKTKQTYQKEPSKSSSLALEFSLSEKVFGKLLKEYGAERVEEAAKYVRSTVAFKNGSIPNISGYFITAIKEHYVSNVAPIQKTKPKKRTKPASDREYRIEYNKLISSTVMSLYSSLDAVSRESIESRYFCKENRACRPDTLLHYEKRGVNEILIFESGFSEYLVQNHPNYFEGVLDFEAYCKDQKPEI